LYFLFYDFALIYYDFLKDWTNNIEKRNNTKKTARGHISDLRYERESISNFISNREKN
jgi:hypothetical protein